MKYSVSIITYTAIEHARRCVESVLASGGDPKLILTAQGNPVAANYFFCIARDNPNVTVLTNDTNQGFIIPSRRAFEHCDTEFFVALNDDTIVNPGWLAALERPFIDFPKCGMSGPVGGHYLHSRNPDMAVVEYIFGWCMMGRTKTLKEIGLFSEYLKGSYCEELDLQMRLIEKGYTLHIAHGCNVQHVGKATSSKIANIKACEQRNFAEVARRFPQYFARR